MDYFLGGRSHQKLYQTRPARR